MKRSGGAVPLPPPPVEHAPVVADRDARPETFPAASLASTPITWVVPHVSPENVAASEVVVAVSVPSRYALYAVTPTLSVDASQATANAVWVVFDRRRLVGVEGGVASTGHAAVDAVIVAFPERLPAGSVASTESVTLVLHARLPKVALEAVVELASVLFLYKP